MKQNAIIRVINKCQIYKTKVKPLYENLNLNVNSIHKLEVCKFMDKFSNNMLPECLSKIFSQSFSSRSYSTRRVQKCKLLHS